MFDLTYFQTAFSEVHFVSPSLGVITAALFAVILLAVSGFASGSEIAFFSLSPSDISRLDTERNDCDSNINVLREDSERTLATILITNNFVNVMIIMLCNHIFANIIDFGNSYWLQFFFITVLLTFILLLFGEIIPKIFARQKPLEFCRHTTKGILFFRKLFWPIENILIKSGGMAGKLMRRGNHVLSVDELGQALELTDKDDIKEEQNMLRSIIRFGGETAKDVMTCRQDIVDLDIMTPFDDVLKSVVDNNYSRIPVFKNNADNICGILYIKDLLPHLDKHYNFRWQSLIRPPYFVPETKKIDELLREFQNNKVHIAIVVDEFGGTSGIVTLEDIMEEIVGEINDEYDDEEKKFVRIANNRYRFEGKTLIADLCKIIGADETAFSAIEGEADTVAGLMLEIKGDFPKVGETLLYGGYSFKIVEIDGRRITKIELTVNDKSESVTEKN